MIFDNFENDEEAFRAPTKPLRSLPSDNGSIQNHILEKTRRLEAGDYAVLYNLYKVDVNKLSEPRESQEKEEKPQPPRENRPIINDKTSLMLSNMSVSMGREASGRSPDHRQRFLETHVQENLDSFSSEDSHSDSFTCQSQGEEARSHRSTSGPRNPSRIARETIDESREVPPRRASDDPTSQKTKEKSKPPKKYFSQEELDTVAPLPPTLRFYSLQQLCQPDHDAKGALAGAHLASLASLEHLEKVQFGVPDELRNVCLDCQKPFRFNQFMAELLNCLHRFHQPCIDALLRAQSDQSDLRCPICNCTL